jgi:hypothetical protein
VAAPTASTWGEAAVRRGAPTAPPGSLLGVSTHAADALAAREVDHPAGPDLARSKPAERPAAPAGRAGFRGEGPAPRARAGRIDAAPRGGARVGAWGSRDGRDRLAPDLRAAAALRGADD